MTTRDPDKMLTAFQVLESGRMEDLHSYIATLSGAHQRSADKVQPGSVHLRHVFLDKLQIGLGYYNVAVTINIPSNQQGMFYVQIPLTARLSLRIDRREYSADPGSGVVISPTVSTQRTSSAGWTLSFALSSTFIRWRLAVQAGFLPPGDLVFEPMLKGPSLAIRKYGLLLVDGIDQGIIQPGDPATKVLVRGLADLLVELQPHSLKKEVKKNLSANQWERLMAVEDFIESHFRDDIGVGDLAREIGCGVRSIQTCVSDYWKCSPTILIRQRRLREARLRLQSGDPSVSVSSVAHEVGIGHPGRFSQMYRDYFGESPAETLRRVAPNKISKPGS